MKKSWLNGKTVIITGASGGLGFEISKILVEDYGAKVIGIIRNEQKMLSALQRITKNKENFSYRIFDVRDCVKWQELHNEFSEKNVTVDVLINNAGFMLPFQKFGDFSEEQCNEIVDTNLRADLNSVRTLLPFLLKSENAHIVNICSSASYVAVIGQCLYTTTKFAMKGFTESLRIDYKGKIKVTGIFPGFVKTDIMRRQKVDTSSNKVINMMMSPVDKVSKKIVKAIEKNRRTLVTGLDGKLMHLFGNLFPNMTASVMAKVLKASKQEIFSELFND